MKNLLYVIPDVHGRTFWREPVKKALSEGTEVVFLGDYLDPYRGDGVTAGDALKVFREILRLKAQNPSLVTLLLGNHDLGYLSPLMHSNRTDFKNYDRIRDLFLSNPSAFQLSKTLRILDNPFLITHAGVTQKWFDRNRYRVTDYKGGEDVWRFLLRLEVRLSSFFQGSDGEELFSALSQVSPYRGGKDPSGSMVWADADEVFADPVKLRPTGLLDKNRTLTQVFGHTRGLVRRSHGSCHCIDCGKVFTLNDRGVLLAPYLQGLVD